MARLYTVVIVVVLPITTQTRPDQNNDQGQKRNLE
jgi:hypothetical protein